MRTIALLCMAGALFGQTPAETPWQILDRGVHDNNPIKRRQAVLAMSTARPEPRTVALIETALEDKDVKVRAAACATLGEIKARTSIPKLQMALADATPEVVFAAAQALYKMGDPAGRQVLMAVLLGDQKDASGFVSTSIRDMKLKFHDPKALAMMGVSEGAGIAGPFGMGVPIAVDLMKDSQASGKTLAAVLLSTDRSPATLAALKDALGDKNWTVRVGAVRAIGLRDATALSKNVAELLDDKRDEVRFAAAAAVLRLASPAGRPKSAPR
jgi:HEAT repeat protein